MTDQQGFPLPSSSYKELVKIIQGYGRAGKDASLDDIAKLTAIGSTTISGNNRFLLEIGVVQGGKRKSVTSMGAELAIALQHEIPDEVAAKWRAIVESNDFLQKVIAAVRIRKGMDETSLQTHVAYSAGQPKTPAVATGAGTVVDILKNAGLLKEESGTLVAVAPEARSIQETVQRSLSITDSLVVNPRNSDLRLGAMPSAQQVGVQLIIEVKVQCSPDELESLGEKLRKVIRDLNTESKPTPPDKPNDFTSIEERQV